MVLFRGTLEELVKTSFAHHTLNSFFGVNSFRVEVEFDAAVKDHRVLWNDSNLGAKLMQINLGGFKTIDSHSAFFNLDDTSEA